MKLQDRNLSIEMHGDDVKLLHSELRQLGYEINVTELQEIYFGQSTRNAVTAFQILNQLGTTGVVDAETARAINEAVDTAIFMVEGKVVSRSRAGVGGLRIELVDKNVGEDVPLAEARTDKEGHYQATFMVAQLYQRGKKQPDLQARVFTSETFLGASDVLYNASNRETLNILLVEKADAALPSEHETLTGSLAAQFRGNLRDLKETDEQQDITYLANKTGWDARAVALAALADQFSARTMDTTGTPAIAQAFFYALFRAGLPANEDTLYHTDAKTLEAVWKKAVEQGVMPKASAGQIPNLIGRFQALSAQKLLTGPALIGASSLKEMLTISKLNDTQQATFAKLYAENCTDMPAFWKSAGAAFGKDTTNRLQVDGKLGFLTINNALLMQKVHTTAGANGLSDPLQLAQTGYHRAEQWGTLLTADVPVPKEIPGDTPETKRANYASYLAAQVRLSYPTAAVAHMVKSGELPLTGAASGVSDQVHAFLTEHQGKFEIGVQPVEQYIAQNKLQIPSETVKQVKRLQRVYQITPSDQALTGLMKHGIDAAYHVVRYDRDTFVKSFAADLGGEDHAALTYDKSVQIHNVVLNIALGYLNARTAPAIGVHSPPSILNPTPTKPQGANAADVIAYPTLEKLFDSMDYCACDHCRSILSPAAYLVDLLMFLHSDENVWKAFIDKWKTEHGNAPYPFSKLSEFTGAGSPGNTEISPFDVLMSRRPDIQHLPLTCENTNTALPYIDVVNETLEYFIANNSQKLSLKDYHGHDTNGAASEDLLASPQFVMDSAYTTLRNERFPAPLPFHEPLENLRRYFSKFEVPLPLAMERLRKTDDLERGANPYGWRDILMEEIGVSRAEYEILTNTTAVPLWRMYGFHNGTTDADVIAGLSNAKQFARRVGITYEDMISVLKTRFINPNSDLIPKLERLGVSFVDLKALKDAPGNNGDAAFDALLAKLAVPPDPAVYGGDIKAWVKDNDNYARIMGLITLAIPTGTWASSKVYASGDCVRPSSPPTGSTLYYECTTSGTSAAAQPNWPTTSGNTCSDGTVDWTCRDVSSCISFDNLAFRYSDPANILQNIGAVEFVRLLRFIRLWKKLSWTIEQTDEAICALYRADLASLNASDINDVTKLNTGFLTLLPRLGIIIRVMRALNLTVKRDLLSLLACWSDIGTHGNRALYRKMFLNPALLKQDAVFADNGYGEFLHDNTEKLLAHAGALRSAFNLTGDEFDLIINALGLNTFVDVPYTHPQASLEQSILDIGPGIGYDHQQRRLSYTGLLSAATRDALKSVAGATADFQAAVEALYLANHAALKPLTLADISAIYRRGWLARKLKLSVRELLLLIQLTGLDPFASPDPTNPAILRLISLVQALKERSLKSAAALYLIWNRDLSGKSAPDPAQVTELARTLRGDFASIDDQFAAIEDPNGDVVRARVTLVYGQETSDAFFALLDDTLVVDVAYTHTAETIENAITAADARIAYDDFRHRLSHSGLVTTAMQTALKNVNGVSGDFQNAVDAIFARSEDVRGSFFARNPELKPIYDTVLALDQTLELAVDYTHSAQTLETAITTADSRIGYDSINHRLSCLGVFTPARRDILKGVPGVTVEFQSAIDALLALSQSSRGAVVLSTLQPELSWRRKRQQALQRISASAGVDLFFARTILSPETGPYPLHAAGAQDKSALDDVLALETPGITAQFFFRDTATGNVDQSVPAAANLDYAAGGSNPLPNQGNEISGIWSGQVEIPEAGFYNCIIEADDGATVTFMLDGQALALTQNGNVWRNTNPLELKAGTLYEIELKIEKVKDALSLRWETPKRGREIIPSRYLYPPSILAPFSSIYTRFLKGASMAVGLKLSADEMAYFATHSDYYINGDGWLNALSVNVSPAPGSASALLKPFKALLDFARIKAQISSGNESLLAVLKNPATTAQDADSLLFTITRWNQSSLNDVLAHFSGNIAGLGHFDLFRRIYDAFALIQQMGISANVLLQATSNEPSADTVRALQEALRARYDPADWREVVRPINDEMRGLKRDALVAYILHQMRANPVTEHINTPDKLFEYFLMDVQMEPCMQTSRIRHALSTVQLFIERCLMNLEPHVSPAAINDKQWAWMKRYRVWEANRKVYLFPENWLEPELRDDKSPFFKEIESELLQGDITEERAATALLNYLSKLEEVAKLEPCGIYHIPADEASRTDEIDHVIARTAGANRKYYYRRYEYGYWTPWEQIKLDIEDNPVIPVVWKGRLLLFWLRILKKAPLDTPELPVDVNSINPLLITKDHPAKIDVQAVLCWSEYYNRKWQPTKTSDVNRPAELKKCEPYEFDRSALRLSVLEDNNTIKTNISDQGSSDFTTYNTHSLPVANEPVETHNTITTTGSLFDRIIRIKTESSLHVLEIEYSSQSFPFRHIVIRGNGNIVQPRHRLFSKIWYAPFFYEDSRHVFFVTTTKELVYIYDFSGYLAAANNGVVQAGSIPPLVHEIDPHLQIGPKFWGDGGPVGTDPGVIDSAPMKRFVTEDAYIRQGLGTTAVIMYGNRQIGPSGAILNAINMK